METSFTELRSKIVVNLVDGRKLGHIIDIVFEQNSAKILGIIVPSCRNMWSIFRSREDIFIPYHCICKIGMDTILVELNALPPTNTPYCYCQQKTHDYLIGPASNDNKNKLDN